MRPSEQEAHHRTTRQVLHVCPACERPFVVPLAVLEVMPDGRFPVVLACRNCDWHDAGAYADEDLAALDYALDGITASMEDALEQMTIATELERIEAFAAALDADGILPEDF
jgi:hypothetical protein